MVEFMQFSMLGSVAKIILGRYIGEYALEPKRLSRNAKNDFSIRERYMCNKWRIGQINAFRELCGILPFTDANCQPRDGVGHYPKGSFT